MRGARWCLYARSDLQRVIAGARNGSGVVRRRPGAEDA